MTDKEFAQECLQRIDFKALAEYLVEALSDYSWKSWVKDGYEDEAIKIAEGAFRPSVR